MLKRQKTDAFILTTARKANAPDRPQTQQNSSTSHHSNTTQEQSAVHERTPLRVLALLTALLGATLLLIPLTPCTLQANPEASQTTTVGIVVDGYEDELPTLVSGEDFTQGEAICTDPCYMVDEQGNQLLGPLIEQMEKEGYRLIWRTGDGALFDWFETPVTKSITVTGSFEKTDYQIRVSFNDGSTQDLEVSVPQGASFAKVYGGIPAQPSKQGHSFVRWVNATDNSTFDFNAPVTSSTTVYAEFTISEPDQVITVDADIDVPETLRGQCYIGDTWSVHPAQFSVSNFTGGLEGCSGTGSCSLPSAAAPSYTWADYTATLAHIDIEAGLVIYDVTITPPGAARPDGPRNSLGLIGYQTVYFQARIQKNFGGYIELQKASANPSLSENNAPYSLEGAVFGIYNKHNERVGSLTTNAEGKSNRSDLLPIGTYTIKEEQAPAGYAHTSDKEVIVEAGSVTQTTVHDLPQSSLIEILLQKYDAETHASFPLGSATLQGAQFRVSYYDSLPSIPDHIQNTVASLFAETPEQTFTSILNTWGTPKRSWLFETDETGAITFDQQHLVEGDEFYYDHEGAIVLPLGTIIIEEVQAPEGYVPLEEPLVIPIPEEGTEPHVPAWNTVSISEQVKRGDLSFTKTREGSMDRLANIGFAITSKTTGESHVLYTDENGMASTETSWTPHSQNTNAGTSHQDGIWFEQDSQGNKAPVNDALGALPYDTYTIEELPCETNKGMALVAFEVTISRDNITLDLGSIDNKPYTPEIEGEVDKRQTIMCETGTFEYTIDYRSTSPTWADEFTTTDILTCAQEEQAFLTHLATPVSFEDYDGLMNVWYRTNLSDEAPETNSDSEVATTSESDAVARNTNFLETDAAVHNTNTLESNSASETNRESESATSDSDPNSVNACKSNPFNPDNPKNERVFDFSGWRIWQQDISTLQSQTLSVEELSLAEGEYITAIAFEHGRIEEGFGTLPSDAQEWQRRDRYLETDALSEAGTPDRPVKHSYTFDTTNATGITRTEESTSYPYAPAVLFMQATEETLSQEQKDLWNDAAIDIYRNLELHDKDKDAVMQTTPESSPIEELISQLPKTSDNFIGLAVSATAAILALLIGIAAIRNQRKVCSKTKGNKFQRKQ